MQRTCFNTVFKAVAGLAVTLFGLGSSASADLIRPRTVRSFPDIAGDVVGSQTYTFDPASKTGTFQVVNAPQFLALGPRSDEMVNVQPNPDGTLTQTLQLKLDQNGRLIEAPDNRFQLYGTVTINGEVYHGLLLEGIPTAFGAQSVRDGSISQAGVFDLNMKITGGRLAQTFGADAYFRVMAQSESTFQGDFSTNFSGAKPLTNLRALQGRLPAPVPEPTTLVIFAAVGLAWLGRCASRRG
ncbi:PEP-CTERM sorting domain-containing protein [Aquisphaera insulae]|uniref:PEP-CTERM sorting domain-containing protein n=1 Tax=Aquisphaera insulae TaxID=2712864 RepID=UPI0013ECB0EF|nr:PEP-CTERM sorting domain-containing protein [Aquisphaera insulae]